jgi:high-affinity nickel-transport protein
VALLVLSTIKDPFWAAGYLLVFGLGTILGMIGLTAAAAWPFMLTAPRFFRVNRALAYGTGLASVGLGLLMAWGLSIGTFR